jgi:hypothetical protein
MSHENPYAAPVSDVARVGPLDEDRVVTPQILEAMVQTRPWVLFLAVLGFVATGICLLVALATFSFGTFARIPIGGAGFAAALYLLTGALYGTMSLHLWRYAASIVLMREGYGVHALTDALRHQRAFWRLAGIVMVAMVVLWTFAIVVGVLFR